ncbi:uncharacterized protein LOC105276798 isoform X2 [Ooceraea biroi]|uniref:uncharacterized protein LOC105276798 isoform X2 n=1 Tax=Ooceraea biroi TaxID=2015173 RepID=UPI0005BD652C|nr:uncharacterized protein LOC105276798 isoform X2 [Ooceraea biroi]
MIESKGQTGGIPPGMHVKLIISFRCDTFDEPEEMLVINVQHGRSVIIKLRGYRDPPILTVINIPYFQYPQRKLTVRDVEWIMEIPFQSMNSLEEFIDTSSSASSTPTESIPKYKTLKNFDCGECFVGEEVTLPLTVKNVGGEGRFFIMSEIDWCSMHIEDITNDNMLVLPCFAMWPAYFTLKPQEYIHLYIYFFPDAHGLHVYILLWQVICRLTAEKRFRCKGT